MPTITYLNFTGVSELTGTSSGYLRQLHMQGKLPAPDARLGGNPGWLPATIKKWQRARNARK